MGAHIQFGLLRLSLRILFTCLGLSTQTTLDSFEVTSRHSLSCVGFSLLSCSLDKEPPRKTPNEREEVRQESPRGNDPSSTNVMAVREIENRAGEERT